MDYARYNYIAQPGDDVNVFPQVGPYDHHAVHFGYRPIIGASTPDEERDTLHQWAKASETNKMLRFGSQQWLITDPTSQTEDLGDDPIKASTYGVKNLKYAMSYLYDAVYKDGDDYRLLVESYDDIFNQWRREMGHVANVVGGVEIERKVLGSAPGPVNTPVSKERQQAAVAFVGEYVFDDSSLASGSGDPRPGVLGRLHGRPDARSGTRAQHGDRQRQVDPSPGDRSPRRHGSLHRR